MRTFLLFRLYGPLAAWGEVAVGEQRPSAERPSKSAILGLVAGALGIARDAEAQHAALAAAYGFACRVEHAGEALRDFHTAQVPPQRRKAVYRSRRDALLNEDLYTILSTRDYRTDARSTVALWCMDDAVPHGLDALAAALRRPQYAPYLGRKSCPLAAPLAPALVAAATLKAAFDACPWPDDDGLLWSALPLARETAYYWEALDAEQAGMAASMVYPRRDQVLSRRRWQFAQRDEFFCSAAREETVS